MPSLQLKELPGQLHAIALEKFTEVCSTLQQSNFDLMEEVASVQLHLEHKLAIEEIVQQKEKQSQLQHTNLAMEEHLDSLKLQMNASSVNCIGDDASDAISEDVGPHDETNAYFDKFEKCMLENSNFDLRLAFLTGRTTDYSTEPSVATSQAPRATPKEPSVAKSKELSVATAFARMSYKSSNLVRSASV
jgi:hypothetical protein